MKRGSQKKIKKNISASLVKTLVLTMLVTMALFFPRIRKIECYVDGQANSEICSQLSFLENKSLFFTNLEKSPLFQQVLVNDLGQVFLPVKTQKKLPSTLLVTLSKEDPLYRISFEDKTFLVNSMNFLAEDSQQFMVPSIQLSDKYSSNIHDKKFDPMLNKQINELTTNLKSAGLNFNQITLDKDNSSLLINNNKFIFSDNGDLGLLISKISVILSDEKTIRSQIPIDKKIKEIDMRFDLPIVRFE